MNLHTEAQVRDLSRIAQQLRIDTLTMVYEAQSGHLGGPFSAAEILASLYFHHLRIDPERPDWEDRDRFLLSKGHASPIYYAVLARRGFFPVEELASFRHLGSRLNGHPDRKVPGVEIVAGPLGHGLAIGAGMALGLLTSGAKPAERSAPSSTTARGRVYILLGDGELNAGLIWEGAMACAKYKLGNVTAIVDVNGIQQTGSTEDVMPMEPLADKFRSFGWHVDEIDGHNVREILDALHRADEIHARPSVILAHTTKGKGVGFMEYDHRWHGGAPNADRYAAALAELQEGLESWN